ncbi:MAG: hypothetical protein OEM41_08355, partial [Ignavibacteria bacterium]|nr:hypothetical protein [Ignavibacteria bacterium]
MIRLWLLALLLAAGTDSHAAEPFNGSWTLLPGSSTEIDLYGTLRIDIRQSADDVRIVQRWGGSRNYTDTLTLKTGGTVNSVPVKNRVFPTNVFMGFSMPVGTNRKITARWEHQGKGLM